MELQVLKQIIFSIRGHRVMIDFHLAQLYEVETRVLKQAIKRNMNRFPDDFMFQLTKSEWDELITNCDMLPDNAKHSPVTPLVFTEQGVAMLSTVLRSEKAIKVNIEIMRAFVMLRQTTLQYKEIVDRINELEQKYDIQFKEVFTALRYLIEPPKQPRKPIGYKAG